MENRARTLHSSVYKTEYISALEEYHKALGIKNSQQDQLNKLSKEDALVVVTGQQLGVY